MATARKWPTCVGTITRKQDVEWGNWILRKGTVRRRRGRATGSTLRVRLTPHRPGNLQQGNQARKYAQNKDKNTGEQVPVYSEVPEPRIPHAGGQADTRAGPQDETSI